MRSSFRKINYRLRPAKHVERRMILDVLVRLSNFSTLESYRYIGFGSIYFTDFILFHRYLGIQDMISIEKNTNDKARFEFNCPYRCVKMKFGESRDELPKIDLERRSIIWLDYEKKLDRDALQDIRLVTSKLLSGSIVLITVNANPGFGTGGNILDELSELLGDDVLPEHLTPQTLQEWGLASLFRQIVDDAIKDTIASRNGAESESSSTIYQQLFNFRYEDDTPMTTFGGILFSKSDQEVVDRCDFQSLSFVKTGSEPYLIEVPNLTFRELQFLSAQLPRRGKSFENRSIDVKDIEKYEGIYRYFPNYADVDV